MKNTLLLLLSLSFLSACDNNSDCPGPDLGDYQFQTPYFIGQYVDGPIALSLIKQTSPLYPGQRLDDHGVRLEIVDPVYFQDPFFKVASNAGYFIWAAERYGDYKKDCFWSSYDLHIGVVALNFQIESIVVTSNKAWDASHPAGESLNDLIEFAVFSYADFVDSGYSLLGNVGDWKLKLLSEMTPEDFRLIKPSVEFYFKKNPDVIDQHRLKFQFKLKYTYPPLEPVIKIDCTPTRTE